MTEVEKMRSSRLTDMAVPEIQERFAHAKALLARMGGMSTYGRIQKAIGRIGARDT